MKRMFFLTGALLSTAWALPGQTLDECHRLACEHYPEIQQYNLIRLTEQYDLSNAARSWLPQVSLSAQTTWQNKVPEFPDAFSAILAQQNLSLQGLNKDQYKIALEVNQTIWDGGQSKANRRIAEATANEQENQTAVDLYALKERVNDLYFGILLLDERLHQTELTLDLLKSNLEKIQAWVRHGVALQTDADAIEAEWLAVGQQRTQIEASRASYRRMLEIFIGRPLDDKLQRPQLSEPLSRESDRPELKLFQAQSDRLTAQESAIKSATRPKFGFFAQGYYGYPGLDYFAGMFSSDWSWNALIGVKMSWNFGAYYTKKNNLSKLRIARQQVDLHRDIFLFNSRLQVTEEEGEISRLRQALADDDRIVALRGSVREAAESKLRNGVIDTNDLLQKITDEATARSAHSAREIELLQTIYELKHTINR